MPLSRRPRSSSVISYPSYLDPLHRKPQMQKTPIVLISPILLLRRTLNMDLVGSVVATFTPFHMIIGRERRPHVCTIRILRRNVRLLSILILPIQGIQTRHRLGLLIKLWAVRRTECIMWRCSHYSPRIDSPQVRNKKQMQTRKWFLISGHVLQRFHHF